jgi:hypothetical protein
MQEKIRPATSADWTGILAVADQALPLAKDENREWWQNRQRFETRDYRRRHYVVEVPSSALPGAAQKPFVVAYGSIEEGPEENHYRVFLVMAAEFFPTLGERLFAVLEKDLAELQAEVAWAREEMLDPLIDFLHKKGFVDQLRVNLPTGREGLLLAKRLDA